MTEQDSIRRKKESDRQLFRLLCSAVLTVMITAIFWLVWVNIYNPILRRPYVFRGHFFVTAIYTLLFMLFNRIYGGLKLGYYRPFKICFDLAVTAFITNAVSYVAIIIPAATWYVSPVPALILMTGLDIAVIIVWTLICSRMFDGLFEPFSLLLVAGTQLDETLAKFALRKERYRISRVIQAANEETLKTAAEECDNPEYDGVIVGDLTSEYRNDLLKLCYSRGIRTYTIPKITDILLKGSETLHIFDSPIFLNRNTGLSLGQNFVKRCSDVLMALAGLIVSAPLFLIIAAAIKLEDHGPVFFRQKRCTRNGKVFEILKFRSMIVDAEKSGIAVPATEKDPRITKTGSIIRATRLDELPQLINILMGDMSVVGPRPERIEHVEKYTAEIPEFRYRMAVKGGLTGYAQVYGKYNTSAYDKLKLDLLYIENYSIILDFEIILKTIQVLFTKESTEGFDESKSREMGIWQEK